MRSFQASKGLTYGIKMTEEQRTLWTLSAAIMSDYNIVMQDFNEITCSTREQYKDSSVSTIKRYFRYLKNII